MEMGVMEKETIPAVLDVNQLEELLHERHDLRLLDVRTPAEYESAHISGSYNVPLDTLDEHATEIREAVDVPMVLVCQSGSRSRQAEEVLKRAGMPQLHVLDRGLSGWVAAGKPVRRGREKLSLERQVRIAAGALAAAGGLLAVKAHPRFGLLSAFVGAGSSSRASRTPAGWRGFSRSYPTTRRGAMLTLWSRLSKKESPLSVPENQRTARAKERIRLCFSRESMMTI